MNKRKSKNITIPTILYKQVKQTIEKNKLPYRSVSEYATDIIRREVNKQ